MEITYGRTTAAPVHRWRGVTVTRTLVRVDGAVVGSILCSRYDGRCGFVWADDELRIVRPDGYDVERMCFARHPMSVERTLHGCQRATEALLRSTPPHAIEALLRELAEQEAPA